MAIVNINIFIQYFKASYRSSPVLRSSPGERGAGEREVKVVLESETLEELRQYVNSSFHNSELLLIKMTKLTVDVQDEEDHVRYSICLTFLNIVK